MKEYTQEELNELIECPKIIIEAPSKEMKLIQGNRRNSMKLESKDGEHHFLVFMRKHEKFAENFSIGLSYQHKDHRGKSTIIRCNGPTAHSNNPLDCDVHFNYHIHRMPIEDLNDGCEHPYDKVRTKDYASYEEALSYFINLVNVQGAEPYFALTNQNNLFDT
ncbi:MAG: hypothetical protein P9X24_01900 [Candidatus Hatepunaea meridiana]|nr:hypothetical protein [Candidatus Hatepunaea meridiana]